MSTTNSAKFNCDVCGCSKDEEHGRWRIMLRVSIIDVPGGAIYEWDDELARVKYAGHVCGDRCTLTLVERYLALTNARKESGVPA